MGQKNKPAECFTIADEEVYYWIASTLVNDEDSSDEALLKYFMLEGPMKKSEAQRAIAQRDRALRDPLNFVLEA